MRSPQQTTPRKPWNVRGALRRKEGVMPIHQDSTSQDGMPEGLTFRRTCMLGDKTARIGEVIIPAHAFNGHDVIGVSCDTGIGQALAMLAATACIALQKGMQGILDGNPEGLSMEHITVRNGREIDPKEVNGHELHGDGGADSRE